MARADSTGASVQAIPVTRYAARSKTDEDGNESTASQVEQRRGGAMSAEANRKRAAIYVRVSTDRQEREGTSLDEQERLCRELAEQRGYEVVAAYSDVLSGADPERPEYRAMLDAAIGGEFEVIVIYALDRFGRDVIQVMTSLKSLDAAGVEVVPVRGSIDRATPEGQMMTTIEAAFGEWERAKIKIRAKQGIVGKTRRGIPHGVPATGYDRGPDGNWVVNEAEAEVVRKMFRARVEDGLSYRQIAVRLNEAGIPSKFGKRWSAPSVHRVIESRASQGFFFAAGEWHKGRHERIVDEATFAAAQAMVGRDAKFAPSSRGRRAPRHLFIGGHLRCVVCFGAMQVRSGPTPEEDVYVCATHRNQAADDPMRCPTGWHKRTDVDGRFLALFERTFLDLDATRERVGEELDGSLRDVEAQLRAAEAEVAQVERKRARVEADYLAEELGAAAYERLSAKLDDEHRAAVAERDRLGSHAEGVRAARENIDAESETLRRLAMLRDTVASQARDASSREDLAALRGVVAAAFENVYLTADGRIGAMTPGARMAANGHAIPFAGSTGREAPLSLAATGERNVNDSRRTL